MEDGLRPMCSTIGKYIHPVLILVVMEDGLRLIMKTSNKTNKVSLNPCCNGRWSQTNIEEEVLNGAKVLILVVMEDGLRP